MLMVFRASVKTNEPGTAASAPAAALIASPYAGPVAPVVNHVAPAAPAVAAPAPPAPAVTGADTALLLRRPLLLELSMEFGHGAALGLAAPAAAVAYGGAYGLGHGAALGLAAPAGLAYGGAYGLGKALIH
ncbi:hypothetical protein TNIN_51381 [Trichonephila inaurata madagascariensis]|uniref:Uncharacterized protein n=1 Tax=Trichonephila inaurata madagascariensis TaxID=2747483 RepID=A0A8X7CLP8_9ARAC|nr:hypothetical protein TNIN_51381 [Trichonephila inaurata madagascariensis]